MKLQDLDSLENAFIVKFRKHPLFLRINFLPDEAFHHILLQRRFLSLSFTPVYDMAIDGLEDTEAKEIAREIVREEYPLAEPSHREYLVHDLLLLGITKQQIMRIQPTSATLEILSRTFSIVQQNCSSPSSDIKLVTFLRFWGEVLISAEYGCLKERMMELGLTRERSRFYYPHFEHDMKSVPLNSEIEGQTHSDRLSQVLQRLLDTPEKRVCSSEVIQKAFEVKSDFYNQFLQTPAFYHGYENKPNFEKGFNRGSNQNASCQHGR